MLCLLDLATRFSLPTAAAHHAHGSTGSPRALLVARLGKRLPEILDNRSHVSYLCCAPVVRYCLGTTLPEAPDGSSFRWPTASEEEHSYDEQLEFLTHTGAEVLEVSSRTLSTGSMSQKTVFWRWLTVLLLQTSRWDLLGLLNTATVLYRPQHALGYPSG